MTGVAALYLQKHPAAKPAEVSAWIAASATKGKIGGLNPAYPNDLLFSLEYNVPKNGVTTGDRLQRGERMLRGTRLYSANRKYFLAHRPRDSWLCLYNSDSGRTVWCNGHAGAYTQLNNVWGYLTTFDTYGRLTWTTTVGVREPAMIVDGSGYLKIVDMVSKKTAWTSRA